MKRGSRAGYVRQDGLGLMLFTDSEIEEIRQGTAEILERVGIEVEADTARKVFADAGCRVDAETNMVRIPSHVLEEAVSKAPAGFTLAGREPENDVMLGGSRVHFANFGEGIMVNDLVSGENRPSTKRDAADITRMVDYLDQIDVATSPVAPRDCAFAQPCHLAEAVFSNTTKHVMASAVDENEAEACIDMAAAIVGGRGALRERPILSLSMSAVSPLRLPRAGSDVVMAGARSFVPIETGVQALAGATSPQTLAGTLAQQNAEILTSMVLAQLTQPGTPVIAILSTTNMDLMTGMAVVGTPELGLLSGGAAQTLHSYGVPVWAAGL